MVTIVSVLLFSISPYYFIVPILVWFIFEYSKKGIGPISFLKEIIETIFSIGKEEFRNEPLVSIYDDQITTRSENILISNISAFYEGQGGSEPYLILKNKKRVDLPLSWLSKDDQLRVKTLIKSKLNVK